MPDATGTGAGWAPDAPGTAGCSCTGGTAPFFASPGDVPWQRHLHGCAARWSLQGICSTGSSAGHSRDAAGWERPSQGTCPSPLPQLPGQSPAHVSPRKRMAGVGVPRLSLPRDPAAPSLCVAASMPVASAQPVPRGCAVCPGLCRVPRAVPCPGCSLRHTGSYLCPWEPGVPGRWPVARVGCGVGARWARAGLSCCSWRRAAGACLLLRQPCQARGGTCPHRAFAKVRQRKVHAGGGPRVTQQCPVPRLAGRRQSIPTGLLWRAVGLLRQAAWLGLALHCTGPSVPPQGTSPAAVPEPCTALPRCQTDPDHAQSWRCGHIHAPLTLCCSALPAILWTGRAGG